MPRLPLGRVIGVYDDGIIHARHFPHDQDVDRPSPWASVDDMGWYICLCDKRVPGPLVDVPAVTCLACIAQSNA